MEKDASWGGVNSKVNADPEGGVHLFAEKRVNSMTLHLGKKGRLTSRREKRGLGFAMRTPGEARWKSADAVGSRGERSKRVAVWHARA